MCQSYLAAKLERKYLGFFPFETGSRKFPVEKCNKNVPQGPTWKVRRTSPAWSQSAKRLHPCTKSGDGCRNKRLALLSIHILLNLLHTYFYLTSIGKHVAVMFLSAKYSVIHYYQLVSVANSVSELNSKQILPVFWLAAGTQSTPSSNFCLPRQMERSIRPNRRHLAQQAIRSVHCFSSIASTLWNQPSCNESAN